MQTQLGRADIALAIAKHGNTHKYSIHKIDGVNFVKPSDIFAKLFEAIPNEIPTAKNK